MYQPHFFVEHIASLCEYHAMRVVAMAKLVSCRPRVWSVSCSRLQRARLFVT